MNERTVRKVSYSASIAIHLFFIIIFYLIKVNIDYPPVEYVEIGFGSSGTFSSSGAIGSQLTEAENAEIDETKETTQKVENAKDVNLPLTKNTSDDNIAASSKKDETASTKTSSDSKGNKSEGEGSFGYEIEWGGKGMRKIYSYILPAYPAGVNKEIDIRIRFSIKADGTVGTIFPLTKADTQLENLAINSLRQWKFEPLTSNMKQGEQTAVIVFPFRLQ